jgi:uncharacterized protein DUF222
MCSGSGERGNWTSGEIFGEINTLLDRLSAEDLTALPSEGMADDQQTLQRIGSRVQAEFLRRLRRFDSGQGYASTMALSAKAWLRWKCNLTPEAASDQVEVARQLDSLPQTAEAFAEGDISYRHVALIAHTAEELGDKMEAEAEEILVTAARELDPKRLKMACLQLRHCLEPDGVLRDANEQHDHRYLYLSQTLDGVFYLNGRFDPEAGAVVRTALDSVMKPPAADDDRTPKQRRADAWVDLARRQLDGGQLPEVGGQKPHLMVTVDMPTLTKEPRSRAAELEWAQPIPAETARRLACDCTITPILCGAESHQVEVVSSRRVIPPAMKRALIARDRHCRFPGCDMPPAWTDGHHIKHWADGGPTELWNLLLFCRRHHRFFHEGGWTLEKAEGGLNAIPP